MNKSLNICFGALADPIGYQLGQQGLKFDNKEVQRIVAIWDALFTVRLAHILPDSEFYKAQEKLYKQLEAHVMKQNGITKKGKHTSRNVA